MLEKNNYKDNCRALKGAPTETKSKISNSKLVVLYADKLESIRRDRRGYSARAVLV